MSELWAEVSFKFAAITWSTSGPPYCIVDGPVDDHRCIGVNISGNEYEISVNANVTEPSIGDPPDQINATVALSGGLGSDPEGYPWYSRLTILVTGGGVPENYDILNDNYYNLTNATGGLPNTACYQAFSDQTPTDFGNLVVEPSSVDNFTLVPADQDASSYIEGFSAPQVSTTLSAPFDGGDFEFIYPSYEWVDLGAGPNLVVWPSAQSQTIILTVQSNGAVNSTPATGSVSFDDSDTSAAPTATIQSQSVTATDAQGVAVALKSSQTSALEADFSIATVQSGNGSGTVNWAYNPDGTALDFLAGETAVDTATIDVTDQDGNSATAEVTITIVGPPSGLYVTPVNQAASITLAEDTTGSITTAPQPGTIQFTDSDPTTTPTGAIQSQSVTATDARGDAVQLTSSQISALEADFTITTVQTGDGSGTVNWTYNPDGTELDFLAGETAVDTATVDVTDQDGNSATAQVTITIVGPPAALFTTGADTVNFNSLTTAQQAAIQNNPSSIYDGLGGDDVVTLPSAANFNESVGDGDTLNWSSTTPFVTGSRPGNAYTIKGTDGNYDLQLGAGSDTVTIDGDGSSTIAAGSGDNTITITGNGNNTITLGAGDDVATISGTGDNTIDDSLGSAGVTITYLMETLLTMNSQRAPFQWRRRNW